MITAEQDHFPIIKTKLFRPRLRPDLVPRPHLIERLNQGLARELSLVSAPAGYGKSTLVATWLEDTGLPAAWLSLDKKNDHLFVLLRYVLAAIRGLFPEACTHVASLLQAEQLPAVDYLAAELINDITLIPDSFILVLDDYHLLHDEAVRTLFVALIENQPPNLHLAIVTRIDPLLPLARLRASGGMVEIRTPDLRFQDDEAERFLRQTMGLAVEPEMAAALNEQTEGWIAGLRLAVLPGQAAANSPAFSTTNKDQSLVYTHDYLNAEVLDQLPEAIGRFLQQTAILERLSGPLCEAVTGLDDPTCNGQAYLEWLEENNLFTISLDEEGEWHRYHHLFRELLLAQLKKSSSKSQINELHRRASQWFTSHGRPEEALQHALAGDDLSLAVKLVEAASPRLLNGLDRFTLERWLAMLPEEIVWQRPKLLLAQAWLLFRQWRLIPLDSILYYAKSRLDESGDMYTSAEQLAVRGQLQALSSVTQFLVHRDYSGTLRSAKQAIDELSPQARGAKAIALGFLAFSQQALGRRNEALALLQEALSDVSPQSPAKTQLYISLSLLHLQAGDLLQARQISSQLLAYAADTKLANAQIGAHFTAGLLYYEWNNLTMASDHFSQAVKLRYHSNFVGALNAGLALACIYQLQGQKEKAQAMLDELREDTLRLQNSDLLPLLEAIQAELLFLEGDIAGALRWAYAYQPEIIHDNQFVFAVPSLIQSRILLALGAEADLLPQRQKLLVRLASAERDHFTQRAIQILVLLAVIDSRLGNEQAALTHLEQALILAQPGGFIRSFADSGPELKPLFGRLQQAGLAPNYLSEVVAAIPDDPEGPIPVVRAPALLLTRREREILGLIRRGLTNQEIADELVISLYTVKRHGTNIYGKLAVDGRKQAVHKALELGILS